MSSTRTPVEFAVLDEVLDALSGAIGYLEVGGTAERHHATAQLLKLRHARDRVRVARATKGPACKACGGRRSEHDQSARCRGFE